MASTTDWKNCFAYASNENCNKLPWDKKICLYQIWYSGSSSKDINTVLIWSIGRAIPSLISVHRKNLAITKLGQFKRFFEQRFLSGCSLVPHSGQVALFLNLPRALRGRLVVRKSTKHMRHQSKRDIVDICISWMPNWWQDAWMRCILN